MRYGQPSIQAALERLREANAQRILVLPLYPQYASASTGSVFDAVTAVLRRWRWVPALQMINHYADHPDYINALIQRVKSLPAFQTQDQAPFLLFSFHGIPESVNQGSPYYCQCQKTARLIAEGLKLAPEAWKVSFQSRIGRGKWLEPYTDRTLIELAKGGTKRVAVVCPGFAADCLETLEEIAIRNRETFLNAGGEVFEYIPALNDTPEHIHALSTLCEAHFQSSALEK